MTDSMKFGPEWLRNMSAEPSTVGSNNVSGTAAAGGLNSALSIHSLVGGGGGSGGGVNMLAGQGHTAASRNMFPEYRYGREEMLSLFDRNCLLPQILPSFKKLFVEKVQYPLALTPSSEEEINSQSPLGSSSRPAWLQRSPGGFGIPSRGSGRGGTVDRGRMRGKSVYHSIYQRPSAIYDDSLSAISMKPDRNWSERNGTGDSAAVGAPPGGGSGGAGLDWNGTPSSSPRKDFSNHNRNLENWRRNRNEDGSGDGPNTGGAVGAEAAGWRSGGTHRWGRSTSWRDEEPLQGGSMDGTNFGVNAAANIQRSISVIGTIATERSSVKSQLGSSVGGNSNRQMSSKSNQSWPGNSASGADGDDNLPEWAMENPSEVGGTFDSSGAFHGEIATDCEQVKNNNVTPQKQADATDLSSFSAKKEKLAALPTTTNSIKTVQTEQPNAAGIESKSITKPTSLEPITNSTATDTNTTETVIIINNNNLNAQEIDVRSETAESTPTHKAEKAGHSDISERFKEVADEVEKLIMDDDVGVVASDTQVDAINRDLSSSTSIAGGNGNSRYGIPGLPSTVVDPGQLQNQLVGQLPETAASGILGGELSHKPLPFTDQLAMQQHHHHHHHHQQQQQQHHHLQQHQQHLSVLPPHVMNANPNDLWFYRDPQSNVQGPFSAMEMTEWYRAGYFNENLFVRRYSDSRFRPLGELIKLCHGNMPFTHNHLLPTPIDLDNLQITTLTPRKPSALALPLSLNEQQQQHHLHQHPGVSIDEQLKANVTAAADSLSAAVKGHMSAHSMDTSHMLTMRFQMLQDQYLQHQEYQILSELSKSDCFQRMDAAQREAVVRSKVQMLVLPEYLSSFSGLSNSLAALNPIAGSQLYDAIAQQAKKDQQQQQQMFPGSADQRPDGNFLDANDFIMNAQLMHQQTQGQQNPQPPVHPDQVQHQFVSDLDTNKINELHGNDLDILNEYNLRMLLRGTSAAVASQQQQQQQPATIIKPSSNVDFMTESQLSTPINLVMRMWPQNVTQQQQQQQPAQPWPAIPNAKVTLWDVATLEEEQSQQLLLQQQQQQQKRHLSRPDSTNTNSAINLDYDGALKQGRENQCKPEGVGASNLMQVEQQAPTQDQQPSTVDNIAPHHKDQQIGLATGKQQVVNKQLQQQQQQQQLPQPPPSQKQQQQQQGKQLELKISDEERRREQTEEKRRIKEERKRQQQEEEKRRAMLAEEEKNRQQQEEKERQQQIQAQRRKALLGNSQATASTSASPSAATGNKATSGGKIEQQANRSHGTSVAPWSLQAPSVNSAAPGLAEIQKAERRERRADQQRQQEQLDKQMRATAAAAAEANDALLKWQASPAPAPVMNLVDIQAEEAKRLANELLEQQRRREHEQQQHQQVALATSLSVSGGLSNIWGNTNKAWSGPVSNQTNQTATNTGLWDDQTPAPAPPKYVNLGATTAASVLAAGSPATSKQQSHTQAKPVGGILPSPRNLRKSQTLPTMQNVLSKTARAASGQSSQHQQQEKNNKVAPPTKATPKISGSEDKKSNSKVQPQSSSSSGDASSSKVNEYENEFTTWCMKSLDNMSAKVDVPTFVAFLQDLEAPYEVKDYVRIYLGEGKESTDFAKQFLERRSKYKSLQRAQNAHNDDMCKPAPAITPSCNDNGDNKNKQKKIKKNKMTKMDARILGFSVTAAEGRINVGGRDYVDGP
ncbi:GIGYF family protein Gyf [Drosophila montana]|uniref:GIGYF family protein Gyf n=1 Tax=Drosophila montana TaxID=40370 RepID=UPI00313B02F5